MRPVIVALVGLTACGPTLAARSLPATSQVRRGGTEASLEALLDDAAEADGVCVGEQHDDPTHHRLQHAILEGVVARAPEAEWAVGFEMFQRPAQPALDAFRRGDIDAATLKRVSHWDERWGFGFEMYRPLLQTGHDQGLGLLALNAPRELTRAIAREGIEGLSVEARASLPELDLANAAHRRFFFTAMGFGDPDSPHGGHGGGHGGMNPEHFYAAQVTWDETMAESAAGWLQGPRRKVVIVAGNGHCHRVAIPDRVQRRRPDRRVLSVVVQSGQEGMPEGMAADWVVTLPSLPDDDGPTAAPHPVPEGS